MDNKQQKVADGFNRGAIFAAGLAGPIAVVVLLAGLPDVVNAMLAPTTVMLGHVLGGIYDGYLRRQG